MEYIDYCKKEGFEIFIPTHYVDAQGKLNICNEENHNWLDDPRWVGFVKKIVRLTPDITIVVWNSGEREPYTVYKGILS